MSAVASTSAVARASFSSRAAKASPARRTARVVRVQAQSQQPELSRRAAASLLLLPASLTLSKSGAYSVICYLVPIALGLQVFPVRETPGIAPSHEHRAHPSLSP